MGTSSLPEILLQIPLRRIDRVVFGLEGDWSPSVVEVWNRTEGLLGFSTVRRSHPHHRPSLELYLGATWIGIPCFERVDDQNVFDEALALEIIARVGS